MGKLTNKDGYRLVFIISHKFFRGYESYLKYYIENIVSFYYNPLILVVDNNSKHKQDVFDTIGLNENVVFLDNDIECKFELGAYQVGIKYLMDNDLINKFDYCVHTQDNFIIKNKYDFNLLKEKNVTACPITIVRNDWAKFNVSGPILTKLGLLNRLDECDLCWCNSFILSVDKVNEVYGYLTQIIVKTRHESEASERYLGRLLLELNDGETFNIDGEVDNLDYYCHTVDVYGEVGNYFCKRAQQKNETTVDR